ncbi:MAG: hypothetical protein C4547_13820 [Phycisphaerales bacterium]|nr:MAG: hypothetical protein C4547_13820 [Phycisphaerales bacterium]
MTLAVLGGLVAPSPTAPAQTTIYNNFGPGHEGWDYNWGLGWTVAGPDVPNQYGVEQAFRFTPSEGGVVSDIWVAMWYVPLDQLPDEVTVRLPADPDGGPPNPENVLEDWVITEFESWDHWSPPHHLAGSGRSRLEAGKSYWLWAVGGQTTRCGWCMNVDPRVLLPHTLRREGENWLPIANETASAVRIDVGGVTCDAVRKARFTCRSGKLKMKVKLKTDEFDGQTLTIDYETGSTRLVVSGRTARGKVKRLSGPRLVRLTAPSCPQFDTRVDCG